MTADIEDDYDYFADDIDDDDDPGEPIASCERCDSNVYEDDGHKINGEWYCDQCAWWMSQ